MTFDLSLSLSLSGARHHPQRRQRPEASAGPRLVPRGPAPAPRCRPRPRRRAQSESTSPRSNRPLAFLTSGRFDQWPIRPVADPTDTTPGALRAQPPRRPSPTARQPLARQQRASPLRALARAPDEKSARQIRAADPRGTRRPIQDARGAPGRRPTSSSA